MGKKDDFVFDPNAVPEDDGAELFEGAIDDEPEDGPEDEPDERPENSKKGRKRDADPDDPDEDEQDDDTDDDFSDLGLDDEPEDQDDEADKDKSKTSKKILGKFKDQTALEKGYSNLEKELGRMKNEISELKKGGKAPQKEDKPADKPEEPIDLLKIVDVRKLNDAMLTSENPAEEVLRVIAQAFNALQGGTIKQVSKLLEDKQNELQEKYFNEIDQSREERKAAEPYVKEGTRLARKYKADWDIVKPYMQQAIDNNPDLVSSPDDYEPLYKRVKGYLKSKGKLEELTDKSRRQKKTGGSFNSTRRGGKSVETDDEFSITDDLFKD